MTRNPLSFDKTTSICEAAALLDSNGLAAAPIVDNFGRPEGLVTRAACDDWQEFCLRSGTRGFNSEVPDLATVVEIATPFVETIHFDQSTREVIDKLVQSPARTVYVENDSGRLIGVVSTTDVLRHLLADCSGLRNMQAGAIC
jgi:CBS domain-containing protein